MIKLQFGKKFQRWIRLHSVTERIRYQFQQTSMLRLDAVALELPITPGDIIIDCGANVGDLTSKFARAGATVYAFEPNPVCFQIIRRRFRWLPTVHCLNKGVWNKDCTLQLSTPQPHAGFDAVDTTVAASLKGNEIASSDYQLRHDVVECVDIDAFIRQFKRPIALLKIDIEGAEIEVLNRLLDTGAIDLVNRVVVETHEKQMPQLTGSTERLRLRIREAGLQDKISLDWY